MRAITKSIWAVLCVAWAVLPPSCVAVSDGPTASSKVGEGERLSWDPEERSRPALSLTASDGTGLALVSVSSRSVVEEPLAFTELHLVFENPEARVLEGRFEIMLPPGASVSRFAMRIGEQLQEGEVVELQQARRTYEDFLHRKQDPALLEQGAGNQFSARVFPIGPREKKELILSYSQEVTGRQIPLVPLSGTGTLARLSASVHLADGAAPAERVDLENAAPAGDLVFSRSSANAAPALRHDDLAVFAVRAPSIAEKDPLGDTIVLLDTSASRALDLQRHLEAVDALARTLAKQRADLRLVVVAYDQTQEVVYDGAAVEAPRSLREAVKARGALGATDLAAALDRAARIAEEQSLGRLVVIGDGIVTAGEPLETIRASVMPRLRAAGIARVDVMAAGALRDEAVLRALTTGEGLNAGVIVEAEAPPAELEQRLTTRAHDALAVNVPKARWYFPKVVQGVQAGDDVLVYAELEPDAPLTVALGDAPVSEVQTRRASRPLIERAWAKAKIESLLAQPTSSAVRDAVVALSTRYRVLSPFTSLLVLESEHDYDRYRLDRKALSDILTIREGRLSVLQRDPPTKLRLPRFPRGGHSRPTVLAAAGPNHDVARREPADPPEGPEEWRSAETARRDAAQRPRAPVPQDSAGTDALWLSGVGEGGPGGFGAGSGGPRPSGTGQGLGRLGLSGVGEGNGGIGLGALAPVENSRTTRGSGGRPPAPHAGSHATSAPLVRLGFAAVSGRLAVEGVQRTLRRHYQHFRVCHEASLARSSSFEGRVRLRFVVGEDGRVLSVNNAGSDHPDARLIACLIRAVQPMTFSSPEGGTATVTFPLMLPSGRVDARAARRAARAPVAWAALEPERPRAASPFTGRYAEVDEALSRGDVPAAVAAARRWREEAPGDLMALLGLGAALERAADPATAARAYGSIVDLFPQRADLRRYAAVRLASTAVANDLARDSLEKAVADRPDHPHGHRLLAYALVRVGQFERAFSTLESGLSNEAQRARTGVREVLEEDLGLVAAAWLAAHPEEKAVVHERLRRAGAALAREPSLRFVLSWETDANDVDLHVYDQQGGHAFFRQRTLPSGGLLLADVTDGYGPEAFVVDGRPLPGRYTLQAHYYARGPMGFGMGTLQIIDHDGAGHLHIESRPFLVMADGAYVDLGHYTVEERSRRAKTPGAG